MNRIMFVCHGNICRSPMAEFILKDLLKKNNIDDVTVSSSATSTEEIWNGIGNPVYPPAKRELEKHGISCQGKRAVQLRLEDYDKYDIFITMDERNTVNAMRILGGDPEKKVIKLLDLAGRGGEVSAPWYSGRFDIAYDDILYCCKAVIRMIINEKEPF